MAALSERIKKMILRPWYKRIQSNIQSDNSLLLVGASTYNNLGDHLLSQKSIDFLKENFPDKKVVEIPTQVFIRYKNELAHYINRKAIVCISAGGWMGNLWAEDELRMQHMLEAFSMNKMFILPQTVYYDKTLDNYKYILDKANACYKKCSDLTLFVRESNSYNTAKELLKIKRVFLAPDMGLYGEKTAVEDERRLQAFLCLRNDREAARKQNTEKTVIPILTERNYSIGYFDTITKHNIPTILRKHYLNKLIRKLKSQAYIVITDRLHGMIFAVVCGCRCVAFDNRNHKVSGVYNSWLANNSNVVVLDDNNQFDAHIIDNLTIPAYRADKWAKEIDSEFNAMAMIMKEG